MKCLILGGGGFLGYHLCLALLAAGHEVRIFDRPNRKRFAVSPGQPLEWTEGDLANVEDLEAAVSGCDMLYHLICTTWPKSSNDNPLYDLETNVVGTLRLLELVRTQAARKRLLFVSSGGTVYGLAKELPIKESHPTDPLCSHGIAKLAIEKYLFLYRQLYGLDYHIYRLANLFGERQEATAEQGAVRVFLDRARRDEDVEIWGDGAIVRDYIYVKDAADALVRAATHTGEPRIINIGSGAGRSLNDLIGEIEKLTGKRVRRQHVPGRAFDVPSNILDISLAADVLGWRPRTPFQDALSRTLAWMQQGHDRP